MNLAAFEDLLKGAIGLDVASIGASAVRRAVDTRIEVSGAASAEAYLERARASAAELAELVETVVVPETWFFRQPEAFAALARVAKERGPRPAGPLRILSVPCSSGEEPYSIVMTLLDAGLQPGEFLVDAVDVSGRVIEHARRGLYGKNSFRGGNLDFRERYFAGEGHGHRLAERVRALVQFRQGNLLAAAFSAGPATFDVVFCRNLLIYFDTVTQERALGVLTRLIKADGYAFVGPSEANLLLGGAFDALNAPMAFAFQRHGAQRAARAAAATSALPVKPHAFLAGRRHRAAVAAAPSSPAQPTAEAEPASELTAMQRLADEGHLVEAARRCEAYLKQRPSPDVLMLLGVIRDSTGNPAEAAELYRKALYLDPRHHEALAHWALLLERLGDDAGARALNERMRRVGQRRTS